MKKHSSRLRTDVESLVKESVEQEATHQVWTRFEEALLKLDSGSFELFRGFMRGMSIESLAKKSNLSYEETEAWLKKIKRELNQHLRGNIKVRQ